VHDPIDIAFGLAVLAAAVMAAGHAVIYKRDSRSASIWVLVIMALPAAGPVLYLLMGINRVQRRAVRLRRAIVRHRAVAPEVRVDPGGHLAPLARLVGQVVKRPLLTGNSIEVLVDGAAAYPAMLEAIDSARASIALASYIFNGDGVGAQFVAALERAAKRGVAIRVLVDDVDARFSWSSACKPLRRAGITV
jgi:cardiolipin synthase